ncbi:hypothetical protein EDD37DRAFT_644432 [Exophiala viscosa]|uniref:uncharacterized protein n=1 Tax=Exophiala viscosa TaxID=2486360 RepID=UPI0021A23724|nr:hypothetical protein EDD37DRAFT_644432 [Exophiala viscosa]
MAKKRKADQIESDNVAEQSQPAPTSDKASAGSASQAADGQKPVKKSKSKGQSRQERSERRSTKKRKTKEQPDADTQDTEEADEADGAGNLIENAAGNEQERADALQPIVEQPATKKKSKKEKQPGGKEKPKAEARFIVFVGNLPYDVTADQIRQHFIKIAPSSVRLTTDKQTGRSKGFAFLEFDAYDKMKTCLKLYHHSIFDPSGKTGDEDGQEPTHDERKKGRKINVELTAGGGGGKSKDRKAKIRTKNEKLDEERARQRTKEKEEKEKTAHKKKAAPGTGANAAGASESGGPGNGAIHPSRLRQMQH